MRFNRWISRAALKDVERLCANHPQWAEGIRLLAGWIIEQLAENANEKGETRTFPNGNQTYNRWAVGPVVVIFRLLPLDDY